MGMFSEVAEELRDEAVAKALKGKVSLNLVEFKLLANLMQQYALEVMDEAGNTAPKYKRRINAVNKLLVRLGNELER